MATTRLMPLHIGKGRDISTAIADIIDYVENPQKTDLGKFIYGYECDTRLADAEFLLSKRQYANLTGRNQGADDVIAYHLRQAFKPGEVTPEEANQIGRELALKLTKGNHALLSAPMWISTMSIITSLSTLLHWTVRKNFATSGVLPGQSGE